MNKLKCVRNKKIPPQKDQKILLSSNLLVVNGMIELYKSTNDKSILKNINSIIEFICERMFKRLTFLPAVVKESSIKSFLDDYGYFYIHCSTTYKKIGTTKFLRLQKKRQVFNK